MSDVKIKPLADRVVVKPLEAQEKPSAELLYPIPQKEKPQRGTVMAAGPGTKDEKMEVKVGDVVLYGKYAGTEINLDGKDYLIMKQTDIFAIV